MSIDDLEVHGEYILVGHEPMLAPSFREWAEWMQKNKYEHRQADAGGNDPCRVGSTHIGEVCWVSTVFLGIDHSFGDGPPVLFESMIFGGPLDQEQERYVTWDEAAAGHERLVRKAEAAVRLLMSETAHDA